MESSYLMAAVLRAAVAVKRSAIELAKVFVLVLSLTIPMYAIVMPYCSFMADNMMPADTPERLFATMAGIVGGAALMWGIPLGAFWLYGRKIASRLWP